MLFVGLNFSPQFVHLLSKIIPFLDHASLGTFGLLLCSFSKIFLHYFGNILCKHAMFSIIPYYSQFFDPFLVTDNLLFYAFRIVFGVMTIWESCNSCNSFQPKQNHLQIVFVLEFLSWLNMGYDPILYCHVRSMFLTSYMEAWN